MPWFLITGVLSWFTGLAILLFRPDLLATYHYNQYAVAVAHLLVLGSMLTLVMGATYRLLPLALRVPLHSERLARWQFGFHVVGFTGMVWTFWRWDLEQVGHFASVLAVGVALYAWNVVRTLLRTRRWDAVAQGIASATGWLAMAVLVGLALAAGKCTYDSAAGRSWFTPVGFLVKLLAWTAVEVQRFEPMGLMHAHAHLGGAGFLVLMILALSYRLVPTVMPRERRREACAFWSIWLFNAGLAGLFVTLALHSAWKLLFAVLLAAAVTIHGIEMSARLRGLRRQGGDCDLCHGRTVLGLLTGVAGLGVVLCWPGLPVTIFTTQLESVYGFLGLMGAVGLVILGFLSRSVPGLVRGRDAGPPAGAPAVAGPGNPIPGRLQRIAFGAYLTALVLISAGSAGSSSGWVRVGVGTMLLSLLLSTITLVTGVRRLGRPRA